MERTLFGLTLVEEDRETAKKRHFLIAQAQQDLLSASYKSLSRIAEVDGDDRQPWIRHCNIANEAVVHTKRGPRRRRKIMFRSIRFPLPSKKI